MCRSSKPIRLGANRIRLRQWNLGGAAYEIARAGALTAREAVEEANSRFGLPVQSDRWENLLHQLVESPRRSSQAFADQIRGLLDGGVDLFILETFIHAEEARIVLEEVRKQSEELPVLAPMSFTDEGKTVFGNKPEEIVRLLSSKGADVVGANCSVGPHKLRDVMQRMLRVPGSSDRMHAQCGSPSWLGEGICI